MADIGSLEPRGCGGKVNVLYSFGFSFVVVGRYGRVGVV